MAEAEGRHNDGKKPNADRWWQLTTLVIKVAVDIVIDVLVHNGAGPRYLP
jgi:hypothetical protein